MRRRLGRLLAVLALVAAVVVAGRLLPLRDALRPLLERLPGLGLWGLLVLAALYTPVAVFLLPSLLLTLALGYFYPLPLALLAASLGSTTAAALVFLLGRTFLRSWVERRFGQSPRFRALDGAVAEDGWRIVLLTRLSPLFPYVVLNYAFSLTRVPFRTFVLVSWVGMLPGALMYVYLGASLKELSEVLDGQIRQEPWQRVVFVVGLLLTVAATVVIARTARRALARALHEAPA
jgi:uncharacterized membrane protein YdjX (TVP38/TMEM64 family)